MNMYKCFITATYCFWIFGLADSGTTRNHRQNDNWDISDADSRNDMTTSQLQDPSEDMRDAESSRAEMISQSDYFSEYSDDYFVEPPLTSINQQGGSQRDVSYQDDEHGNTETVQPAISAVLEQNGEVMDNTEYPNDQENESNNERYRGGRSNCKDNNRGFRIGEVFTPVGDPCSQCICQKFGPNCTRTICDQLPAGCLELTRHPQECCPVCRRKGCTFKGRILYLHETVKISACETCICTTDGKIQCSVADCTPPPCVDGIIEDGECCPVCPNGPNCNATSGVIISASRQWVRLPNNPCIECRCWHRPGSEQLWMGNREAVCRQVEGCEIQT